MSVNKNASGNETAVMEPPKDSPYVKEWNVLTKMGLKPTQVVCSVLPGHPDEEACKTRLIPNAQNILNHIENAHGGGFTMTVKQVSAATPWTGWADLARAGMKIQDLTCRVCNQSLHISARDIESHLRSHRGSSRGSWNENKMQILFHIGSQLPPASGDEFDADPDNE